MTAPKPVAGKREDLEDSVCATCLGTGYVPGTDTEQTWGDPCPNGCAQEIQRLRAFGQG